MVAVGDDLGADLGILNGGGDDTGVAVVDGGHGVVQVGQVGDTGVHSGLGVVVVGIGVGDGDGAQLAGLGDELGGTGQLRSHVDDADQTAAVIIQLLEALEIGVLQVVGVLGTALGVAEEGTLHLDAAQDGQTLDVLLHQLLGGGEGLGQDVVGQSHGSGSEGSDTPGSVLLGHGLQALVITVGEVGTGAAVAVDLDQAGDDGGTAQVDGIGGNVLGQDGTELAVHDLEGTQTELIVNKDSCIGIKHGILPPVKIH